MNAITNAVAKSNVEPLQVTINGIARIAKVTPEMVRKGLLRATSEELRKSVDTMDAVALYMHHSGDDVAPDHAHKMFVILSMMDAVGKRGMDVDLSSLADEVEAEGQH